jgi:hypothetical protein
MQIIVRLCVCFLMITGNCLVAVQDVCASVSQAGDDCARPSSIVFPWLSNSVGKLAYMS